MVHFKLSRCFLMTSGHYCSFGVGVEVETPMSLGNCNLQVQLFIRVAYIVSAQMTLGRCAINPPTGRPT